jgi:hypothetical protein
MAELPPDYPCQLFPNDQLPAELIVMARLVVQCRFALAGSYGAAIILKDSEAGPQFVIRPIEEIDDWVDGYLEQRRRDGAVDIDAQPLMQRDIEVAQEIQLAAMDKMLHQLDPNNRVT